jgi:hypothetical protein
METTSDLVEAATGAFDNDENEGPPLCLAWLHVDQDERPCRHYRQRMASRVRGAASSRGSPAGAAWRAMLGRRPERFPFEEVRDLIGLARSIYLAAKAQGAGRLQLRRIESVGRELLDAYELALTSTPGTIGMRAAWVRAEDACRAVAGLVTMTDGAEPVVRAAMHRVRARGKR